MCERGWESEFLEDIEWSADLLASWNFRIDWNTLSIVDPLARLESVPFLVYILVNVATMMPVSLIPTPSSMSEAFLGWAPVVEFIIIPSVPNLLVYNPLPLRFWSWSFVAPFANGMVIFVLLYKIQASLLCSENLLVILVNLSQGLPVVLLVSVLVGSDVI